MANYDAQPTLIMPMAFTSFEAAIMTCRATLKQLAVMPTRTLRWQASDVKDNPSMQMREVLHTSFMVLPHVIKTGLESVYPQEDHRHEDLNYLRDDIRPNLPWADDHFDERVCGEPVNPGETWKSWPYAHSADKAREVSFGPIIPPQDWAYLAGMIDGEGTIYFRDQLRWQGVIRVYQKDKSICDYLCNLFKAGKVTSNKEDTETTLPNGRVVDNHCFYWQVNAAKEVRWLLTEVLPYLRIKMEKARSALEKLTHSFDNPTTQGSPQKLIWDKEWEPRFNHNYMSRYWPKGENGSPYIGMKHSYGDLFGVVRHLHDEPTTRQAYLPVWFPEDTGDSHNGRKPCTLGYHFIMRNGRLDITYYIRSCDIVRHFQDDIYLTVRLQLWVLQQLRQRNPLWNRVKMGTFVMHITSLHCFENDYRGL